MIKELNSIGLTDCSNMMKNEYQQLNAETESSERPGTEVSKRFWSNIWGTGKSCNKNSGWLKELRSEKNEIKHCKIQTTPQMVV